MSFKTIEELELTELRAMKNTQDSELSSLEIFFRSMEKATEPTDTSIANSIYSKFFLFCDPDNANTIAKEDFLKFLPKMSEAYIKMGFQNKKIKNMKAIKLDNQYFLVYVIWEIMVKKDDKEKIFDNIKATYILKKSLQDKFEIIFQLDHQKLGDLI